MKRRALLTSLSASIAAVAGCNDTTSSPDDTSTDSPTATPTDSSTPTPTESSTQTPADQSDERDEWDLGSASIVDLETANRTYALAPLRYRSEDHASVRLRFSSTATSDSPATVEARLTNENSFENTFRLRWTPPFGRFHSDIPSPMVGDHGDYTYRDKLLFAPTDNHDLVDDGAAVVRDSDGHWRLDDSWPPDFPETVRLTPDETVYGEYALVGHDEGRGRPPGTYEFSRGSDGAIRVTVWETDAPGPASGSTFTGESVPSPPKGDETAWFHEADASTPTFVYPSVERTELPARVEFTFVNRSRESTTCGHWNLYKHQGGDWFHLGPYRHTADCRVVRPGGTKQWTMQAATGELPAGRRRENFEFLGGGRYAAVAGYGHATPRSAALVEFDAPPVSIVPTDGVTADREDGTVTVTGEAWRAAPDSEHRSRVQLVLERADEAGRTFIAEQVMRRRFRGLRNALAFAAPDVDRVLLRTDDQTADRAIGYDDDELRFRYDEQSHVIRKTDP
jgi:hypothetical protein